jgi:hypothetical protein
MLLSDHHLFLLQLVRKTLQENGATILFEADIPGEEIDKKKLIDQHYYAIGTFVQGLALQVSNSM